MARKQYTKKYKSSKNARKYILDTKVTNGQYKVLLTKNKPRQRIYGNEIRYPHTNREKNAEKHWRNINSLQVQN